ncbi:hypothetical protein H2200_007764 [Cladophialophora chaetospira]|uniref:Phosphatidylinositol-specific phospholipase C X domain-containing protein n=1 Tax=Cladophialophora chaetospira TaxID=386627 RepID=A0AA38X6H0_9EURO|nr:hypothetical protein H2200_007764 [Cladophialophora chaetospira]
MSQLQSQSLSFAEGGTLLLINGTPYTWKRAAKKGYQMNSWKFPRQVKPGTVATVYLEFKRTPATTRSDTNATCNFDLKGTKNCAIRIEVTDSPPSIDVQIQNFDTPNNPGRSWLQLGWQHDGVVCFILSGKEDCFSSSNPPRDWMQQNLQKLGPRPLHKICLPGTHDAGMGKITHADIIPKDIIADFTQTQSLKIAGQLQMGSRYFDIRPDLSSGAHWTGHYTGHYGARGQKMSSVIDDINTFTEYCAELIIINLSHSLNSDDGWRKYNQKEWNSLFRELLRLNHRFLVTESESQDLSLLPLSRFIGSKHAAVVIVVEAPSDITLGTYVDKGFYLPDQLNVYNVFTNTSDCPHMVHDQLQKMQNHMVAGDKRLFLISWTLTQQAPKVSPEALRPPNTFEGLSKLLLWKCQNKTIRELAYTANKALCAQLFPRTGPAAFPNVVYIDFMENRDCAALAMAINDKAFTNTS